MYKLYLGNKLHKKVCRNMRMKCIKSKLNVKCKYKYVNEKFCKIRNKIQG